jgi:hypothetical protein
LTIADKHAGKMVRCPSCNRAFAVPKPQAALTAPAAESDMDLEALAQIESSSGVLSKKELSRIKAAAALEEQARESDETLRTCPACQTQVRAEDAYADVLCSNCWQPIPAKVKGGRSAVILQTRRRKAAPEGPAAFYADLIFCLLYPLSAIGSMVTAAIVAVIAALIPAAVITGGLKLMQQQAVGTAEEYAKADLSGVTVLLLAVFGAEVFVFLAIALHLFLDVIRTTFTKNDRPPNLAWSPAQWGRSFVTCLLLAIYYALMTYLVAAITISGDLPRMLLDGRIREALSMGGTNLAIGVVLISLVVPMSLVGTALTSVSKGMNPVNVIHSIVRTHAHYVFLVLLLSVYGILFAAAFIAILFEWFLPSFDKMVKGSAEGDLAQVALSLVVWGVVMGFFYYGTYVLARLHGLFARAFQKQLMFAA